MGLKIYGIAAAQVPDSVGETIDVAGIDTSKFSQIIDEHHSEGLSSFHLVGGITSHKKIFSAKDCTDAKQLRCWNTVQAPLLYCEAELADGEDHPNAKAAAALLRFTKARPEIELDIGFSIDGAIYQRQTKSGANTEDPNEGKILSRTAGVAAALTPKPCNTVCKVFLENDLTKSDVDRMPIPERLPELLAKSQSSRSFTQHNPELTIALLKLQQLRKSIDDLYKGTTSLKCKYCGNGVRLFKAGKYPNHCAGCQKPFSLSDIWKAMNA